MSEHSIPAPENDSPINVIATARQIALVLRLAERKTRRGQKGRSPANRDPVLRQQASSSISCSTNDDPLPQDKKIPAQGGVNSWLEKENSSLIIWAYSVWW